MKQISSPLAVAVAIAVLPLAGMQSAQAQVSPETLKSISMPDKVETSIGKLEFFDGVPANDQHGRQGLRQSRPHARRRGVTSTTSAPYRCRACSTGLDRAGAEGAQQDRLVRRADGFEDPGGHCQHLDALRLCLHRSGQRRPDGDRDSAGHARLPRRRLATLRRQHGRDRAGQGQGRQVSGVATGLHGRGARMAISCSSHRPTATSCSCAARSRRAWSRRSRTSPPASRSIR